MTYQHLILAVNMENMINKQKEKPIYQNDKLVSFIINIELLY